MRILNSSARRVSLNFRNGAIYDIEPGAWVERPDSEVDYLDDNAATLALFSSGQLTLQATGGGAWAGPALPALPDNDPAPALVPLTFNNQTSRLAADGERVVQGAVGFAPRLSLLSVERPIGFTGQAGITCTMHRTIRAPAHFDAVQLILRGSVGSSANAFKASVAVSAKRGNGYVPVDAADAELAFTPVTFGLTDRFDFRNRGGGSSTALVNNVVSDMATATNDFWEGNVPSDWMPLRSLDRADDASLPPLLMIRLYGVNPPAFNLAEAADSASNPFKSSLPDHFSAYWSTDVTGAANPGSAPVATSWQPAVDVVFLLRGRAIATLAVCGDSIDQGWIQSTAVPQFGGNIEGWGHKFVKKLRASGTPCGFYGAAYTGNHSIRFHNRAHQAIESGGVTHAAFKVWSTNETGTDASTAHRAMRRTDQIIELALRNRVRPIIIRNWAGQQMTTTAGLLVSAYVQSLQDQGVPVFDARHIINVPGSEANMLDQWKTLNSGGGVVDTTHINEAAQDAVADYAMIVRHSVFAL